MRNRPETVTASEIADYVFCPESFRLAQVGYVSSNQRERAAGTKHHFQKAIAERLAGCLITFGRLLILLALLALLWKLLR